LVNEISLYYDARSKKHQIMYTYICFVFRFSVGTIGSSVVQSV